MVVDNNDPEHCVEDFALMRLCRHFVLSNSTFGWWAAWLSDQPGKIVVAPEQWYTEHCPWNHRDLLPEDWVKVPDALEEVAASS
jgi:hypothetical protein